MLLGGLLLACNGALGPFAGTSILLRVLATNRQAATMADTAIASDFGQTLDVHADFTTQITFNLQVMLDVVTQLADFGFGEILHPGVRIDTDIREHLL